MAATTPPIPPARHRKLRTFLLVAAALLALFMLAGFFAVPLIAKSRIESFASSELGRRATVGKVRFNPFTLRVRLSDFVLLDRDPGRTLLEFDTLDVDVSTASLWRRAPILDAVRLVRPRVEIARNAQGEYNIQDLVDRAMAPSGTPDEEATFAVNNIEVEDGAVLLDDAVHRRRIELSKLHIGIPFLSSFSRDAQIRVTPRLQGAIDGTTFALNGTSTSPFEDTQQATLEINFDALQLPRYMEYAPLPGGLKLTDGALTTRLTLAFIMGKGSPRGITLTGTTRLDGLAVAREDASPLAGAKKIEVAIGKLDLLGRTLAVDRIAVEAPQLDLRRMADGTIEARRLFTVAPASKPAAPVSPAAPSADAPKAAARAPWSWSVAETRISDGVLRVADEAVSPAFRTTLSAVAVSGARFASKGVPGSAEIAFDSEDGAHFAAQGEVDVEGLAARGHFALTKLPLAKLRPYYASVLAIDIRRGSVDFGADFDAGADGRFILAKGAAVLSDLDLSIRDERERLWRMARASADGIAIDLGKRTAAIDSLEARQGTVRVLRDEDGGMHFERVILREGKAQAAGGAGKEAGGDWRVTVHRLLLERFAADFEDRAPEPDVKLRIADARIAAENLDIAPGAKAKIDVAARVGPTGRVRINGAVSARPASVDARVTASAIDLVPLKPYLESRTKVILTSGTVAAKGRITYADAEPTGPQGRYVGDVIVTDFGALDRPGSQELARWKTLTLTGIDVTSAPFNLAMSSVALDRFYARLILDADAKLNVQQLLQPEAAASAAPAAAAATTGAAPATPVARRDAIPASIGRIQLTGGEIEFSDFFVKPNYSVHLVDLGGNISALAATQAGMVEIAATVDGSAPVDIRGTINPFAKELSLDLTGKATDVELPPLTPYSVKYAGYGIQKGKLTMEVHYKLDNRKLVANNKLVLDQLTFGERVDSPTATKLPVLFAVSLLKDRNGVINLDLPIEGTLDDPEFSVWGVVVQIIGNLLTRAMTAPFALLGAAVGGGGEQLAYVEFAPGRAELTPAAVARLATLAKALADRPALKLDAAGRAIPDVDREGLKRALLDRALRLRKHKDLAGNNGASAPALEAITIDAADYAKYLKAVYRDADLKGKPRNFIGMAKDIPAAEMEALLLASYGVDDDGLRDLADRRAQAVKQWLTTQGNIPAERVSIVAPKLGAEGIKDGAPTRVEFTIR